MVGTFFEEARPGELKANLIIMWREDNIIEEIVEDSMAAPTESGRVLNLTTAAYMLLWR